MNSEAKPVSLLVPGIIGEGARSFRVIRWFLVLGFLSITLMSVASTYSLTKFLTDNMLRRDAVVSMAFVNSFVPGYQANSAVLEGEIAQATEIFRNLIVNIAKVPEVLRANIYARNRHVVWSSERELIGVAFETNADLETAFLGELVVKEGIVGEEEKDEHVFLKGKGSRFIENYLPIYATDSKDVIGVVELYKSPIALHNAIHSGDKLIWVSGALGGIILFITLFWIVVRANSVIEQQKRRLVTSQTMATVGELSSAIVHGFRNPLAGLRSSAELALDENSNSPAHESLNEIVAQSDRLEALIGDLLDGLRPMTLEPQPVQVNSMIAEIVEVFAGQFEKQAIRINLVLSDTLPDIEGNPAVLHQVFRCVIGSMCTAMLDGGELHVSSVLEARDNHVHIAISSIGKGLSEDDVRKVFRPFVTDKGPSLGVGLALAQRIIQRDGGTLEFIWPPSGGTIANIRVPIHA